MLVVDRRPDPADGPAPGFHALIVGVSLYPHLEGGDGPPAANNLGLQQLAAPALTAFRIYDWLNRNAEKLAVPLHTVRLLLAPAATELQADPGIQAAFAAGAADSAGYALVQQAANDWRADVATHADSIAFFFFSGHGLGGTGDDVVMLAADFGDPAAQPPPGPGAALGAHLLQRAISLPDLQLGMVPPVDVMQTIGRRQFFLVDACRNRPEALPAPNTADVPTIWKAVVEPGFDDRELSIMLATINSNVAYVGKPGEPTVFGQAVLECFDGAAAGAEEDGQNLRWEVTTGRVGTYLQRRMDERARELRVSQAARIEQNVNFLLAVFPEPPPVVVSFSTIGATRADNLRLKFKSIFDVPDINPLEPPRREHVLPMGQYKITVSAIQPPPPNSKDIPAILRPPRHVVAVDLSE